MKIKEIHIKNFKRFNNLTIRWLETARLVLLVGSNGSGKSSVLEACNVWYRNKTHNLSHRELGYYNKIENGSFYFKKGNVESFHYKNLSAGEKSAFDLLLDLILKIEHYDDSILFIDEPEIHMHTKLQGRLLEEIYNIIPNECQLWITTHSFGMIKKSRELLQKNPNNIVILDFTGHNFDEQIIIEPSNIDKILWEKLLSIALDDFADLIMPEYIILCEGDFNGKERQNFDASIYNTIFNTNFNTKYPNIIFISAGNCEDLKKKDNIPHKVLSNISNKTKIYKLVDRDDMNDNEVKKYEKEGIIILSRRHLESFLLDDEIIRLFCNRKEVSDDIINIILNEKINILQKSNINRRKPMDDLKSSKGEIYNIIKEKLQLTQHGSNADVFIKDYLAPLVSNKTQIYKELEQCIIQKITPMAQV